MPLSSFMGFQPFDSFNFGFDSRGLGRSEPRGSVYENAFAADRRVDDIRDRVMHQNGLDGRGPSFMNPFFGDFFGGWPGTSQPGTPWDVNPALMGLGDMLSQAGDQARWAGLDGISKILEQLAGVAYGQASSADRVDAGLSERGLRTLARQTEQLLGSGELPPMLQGVVENALGVLEDRIASGPERSFNPWGWFGG